MIRKTALVVGFLCVVTGFFMSGWVFALTLVLGGVAIGVVTLIEASR